MIKKFLVVVFGVLISLVLLISSLEYFTFNSDYYIKKFNQYNVNLDAKIDGEGLNIIANKLTNYLNDKDENLDMALMVDGVKREIFNEKEKRHMIDVKSIFLKINKLKGSIILLLVMSLFISYKYFKDFLEISNLKWIGFYSFLMSLFIIISLIIVSNLDFTKYFIKFHELFFDNKLWILDPNTDILIMLLPEEFFIDISFSILRLYGILSLTLYLTLEFFCKFINKNNKF